jgi:hypothetical protein
MSVPRAGAFCTWGKPENGTDVRLNSRYVKTTAPSQIPTRPHKNVQSQDSAMNDTKQLRDEERVLEFFGEPQFASCGLSNTFPKQTTTLGGRPLAFRRLA